MLALIALIALSLVGCAPQDAEIEGQWYTWLAANTSGTVAESEHEDDDDDNEDGLVDLDKKATVFECSGRGWDEKTLTWDEGYIGPQTGDDYADPRFIGGDCERDEAGTIVDPACEAELNREEVGDNGQVGMDAECDRIGALEYFTEFQSDGYYGLSGPVESWRSEALLNGEGAFQLTVHHDLGDRQDFRFAFSIDPAFAPVICTSDANGKAVIEYIDGASWVDEWSTDEEGYDIYYLNALAYQIPPASTESDLDYWYLPTEWISGFGFSRFAADEFYSYAEPVYNAVSNREEPDAEAYTAFASDMSDTANAWARELVEIGGAVNDGGADFEMKTEDNTWRPIDRDESGLDGFVEVHSSWVRIKKGASFEKGGSVEGDFQLLYSGIDSISISLVRGTFKVDELREDKWAYDDLEDVKRDENGTPFCDGASMP